MGSSLILHQPNECKVSEMDNLSGTAQDHQTGPLKTLPGNPSLLSRRKDEHISICLQKEVSFRKKNGFEKYDFVHRALPEINLADIDTSTTFLGKQFSFPFFIAALTGGSSTGASINKNLAKAAESFGIGMGVGSQRSMLTDPSLTYTYQVRKTAPGILLLGNIGASQYKARLFKYLFAGNY